MVASPRPSANGEGALSVVSNGIFWIPLMIGHVLFNELLRNKLDTPLGQTIVGYPLLVNEFD